MIRKGICLVAVFAALVLMSAACGSASGNDTGSEDERQGESADDEGTSEETETDEGTGEGGAATYAATEFAFEGPDVLPAGDVTLTMDNQGKQMHDLALGELLEGKTKDDIQALLTKGVPKKAPTWFRQVGGTGAAPGETGTIDADLTPGTYLMLCFVPDEASGKPHVMLGMMKEVTVE